MFQEYNTVLETNNVLTCDNAFNKLKNDSNNLLDDLTEVKEDTLTTKEKEKENVF
jgi:hypothetical protein